ncbi:D-Ala-D-Ala dipeptidase vanX. Metallo peptidase. MEROPS family M15D [Maridesulfovibrio ferrireducens]|uniref:D-alanyl-D-alanine dipeptidase n=1 Tax=Maridesulfovibrio ferrireducens TaxID=246191 RepID=A0A1G9FSR8_9BACT|nr:M15 family metallopeptidase [Maridesulfovibrio ferrireducens]SDK91375.1 D-Ala-D-Ala dipeptidase vanX. Metallo peptidase. MEROPS family M15D [Maridesulfovibrio ferrireducens]
MKVVNIFIDSLAFIFISVLLGVVVSGSVLAGQLPEGFCYVDEIIPEAVYDARYFTENNFVGEQIDGYLSPRIVLTVRAAKELTKVQSELVPFGLTLKIFDGYRPQRAVDHFVRWGRNVSDTRMKSIFYPSVDKKNLFRDGYIAKKSGHSRGSTVDLTIADKSTGSELDMGTIFDFFGPASWPENDSMDVQIRANRAFLRQLMINHSFKPLKEEWWHFTLDNEPYPDKYFNFVVN